MKKIIMLTGLIILLMPTSVMAKIQVVGLGDSITTGYGVKEEQAYFAKLATQLAKEQDTTVDKINLAVNGDTSTQLLEHLENQTYQQAIQKADYIFLSIGGNDFLQEFTANIAKYLRSSIDYTEFDSKKTILLQNLEQIIKQLLEKNKTATIVVVPLYNPYYQLLRSNEQLVTHYQTMTEEYLEKLKQFDRIVTSDILSKQLREEKYLNVKQNLSNVDPHPNVAGHQLIADELYQNLKIEQKEIKDNSYRDYQAFYYAGLGILGLLLFVFFIRLIRNH